MDHYDTLECGPAASPDEIKRAYYKLALQWHPDRNDGQDEQFKKIAQAYSVLSDPIQRASYDLTLPPVAIQVIGVQPEELVAGGSRHFHFIEEIWVKPNGDPAKSIPCPRCCMRRHINSCTLCRGSHRVYSGPASKIHRDRHLQVGIPPKSWPGRIIHVERTPIRLELAVPTDYREGVLYYRHRLNIYQALLGLDEEVVILGEKRHLLHPEPIQPSSEIFVPDAGLYHPTGERGPVSILFTIEYPKLIEPAQRQLLLECLRCESEKENSLAHQKDAWELNPSSN